MKNSYRQQNKFGSTWNNLWDCSLMTNTVAKSILFLTRGLVESVVMIVHVCTLFAQFVFLSVEHLVRGDIVGSKKVAKIGFKHMASNLKNMVNDVELLMWAAFGFSGDFLTKENADRFASLNLLSLLLNCTRALLACLLLR